MVLGPLQRSLATHAVWKIGLRESGTPDQEFAGNRSSGREPSRRAELRLRVQSSGRHPHLGLPSASEINAILYAAHQSEGEGGLGSIGVLIGTLRGPSSAGLLLSSRTLIAVLPAEDSARQKRTTG